jgi:plastocyanin
MFFATSLSLCLSLLPLVAATTFDVHVGGANGELAFSPEAIAAVAGDSVIFHFHPKNHSVTQSSFASPCGAKAGGVDSGFMPVPDATNSPTFTIPVNDTAPIWIHCRQAADTANSHCGKGMVFAINCGADGAPNSFTNFKNAALAIGAGLAGTTPTSTYAYSTATVPPAPAGGTVTATITLQTSTWTTTYSSYPGSPNATPAALTGNVIKVVVGGPGKLAFDPPHVAAAPRDTIQFEFHQKNHTVTQSSFANPCVHLEANGVTGFDSGFMAVAADATTFPTWSLTVNDTAPIWAYCRQATHCGQGMVFAINSVETSARNFSAFQALAKSLNGSSSTPTSNSTTTSTPSSAASALSVGGAGFTLALGAFLASLL